MRKYLLWAAFVVFDGMALFAGSEGHAIARAQDGKPAKLELPAPGADGFISLFNGKDLTYWEGYPGYWSVKDAAIQGSETSANSKHTFLVLSASKAEPAKFGNFEIHFTYRWTEKGKGGNSGLQFRSKIIDEKTYKVGGYQADLDVNGQYDGGYYDEAGVAGGRQIFAPRGFKTTWDSNNKKKQEPLPSKKNAKELKALIKPIGEWNSYILVANGNHMTSKVNGELMAELIDDSPKALKEGVLAFQIHSGATMTIQFKDIKIKLLPKDQTPKKTADSQTVKAPTKKWQVSDLVPDEKVGLEGLVNRDFANGKKLFTETKCLACHTFAGEGGFVGPSLAAKGASFGPVDVLVSIIEPSKIIADAYRQKIVEMDDGRVITGMISETCEETEITPDMLSPEKKIIVKTEKIVNMTDSPVSPMPAGLIDNLNRDQILDLIAYVISQDDPTDEMFKQPAKGKK
ncbi:MAG TPA: family 16 glycoside hydrolase [Gemmataceae bacterium]|nr:family 16 glycoside hydrolase [Gemmataceae bacterium]